jgi:hypothetical protein
LNQNNGKFGKKNTINGTGETETTGNECGGQSCSCFPSTLLLTVFAFISTATTPTTDQLKIRKLRKEPAFPWPWNKFDGGSSSAVRIKRKMMAQQREVDEHKSDALPARIKA